MSECQGKEADIVFIIDESSSIWAEDFRKQQVFIAEVISHFDIDNGTTQVITILKGSHDFLFYTKEETSGGLA